jgi:hypothetical protein
MGSAHSNKELEYSVLNGIAKLPSRDMPHVCAFIFAKTLALGSGCISGDFSIPRSALLEYGIWQRICAVPASKTPSIVMMRFQQVYVLAALSRCLLLLLLLPLLPPLLSRIMFVYLLLLVLLLLLNTPSKLSSSK